jgi:hypothetical protein
MEESIEFITEAGLGYWKEAVLEYKSQLPGLGEPFESPEKTKKTIHAYWEAYKGIRVLRSRS